MVESRRREKSSCREFKVKYTRRGSSVVEQWTENPRVGSSILPLGTMWYVYILQSIEFGKYYIGYSADPFKRLEYHNLGKTRSIKAYIPYKIIKLEKLYRSVAQLARASGLGPEGRRFKSFHSDYVSCVFFEKS